jgi:DNA-binding transcriptional MerR regulator
MRSTNSQAERPESLTAHSEPARPPQTGPGTIELTSKRAAALVGVTVRTLRHYHQIGLLTEPARTAAGHRVYTADHVLQLLRIKRLVLMGLRLDEVADIIGDPTSPAADRILAELDRALADRAAEIRSQRRAITEMRQTGAPVDPIPEVARRLAALTRLGHTDQIEQANRTLLDAVAGWGDDNETEQLNQLLDQATFDPLGERVVVLTARLLDIGSDSDESDLAELALDYGQALADVYDGFASPNQHAPWTAETSGGRILKALTPHPLNPQQRDVLNRASTALSAHAGRSAPSTPHPSPRHPTSESRENRMQF